MSGWQAFKSIFLSFNPIEFGAFSIQPQSMKWDEKYRIAVQKDFTPPTAGDGMYIHTVSSRSQLLFLPPSYLHFFFFIIIISSSIVYIIIISINIH